LLIAILTNRSYLKRSMSTSKPFAINGTFAGSAIVTTSR